MFTKKNSLLQIKDFHETWVYSTKVNIAASEESADENVLVAPVYVYIHDL